MTRRYVIILFIMLSILVPVAVNAAGTCDLDTQEDFVNRAAGALNANDYERALADYQCALQINPDNSDALFGRAYSYYNLKEYTESEADYTRYIEIVPTSGDAYNNRGNIYYALGDYDRARADYDKAIALPYEEKLYPYYNRGILNYELGDYTAAINDLSEAIELNSLDSQSYLARALAYKATGDEAGSADIAEWVNLIRQSTLNQTATQAADGIVLSMSKGDVYEIPLNVTADQVIRIAASTTSGALVDPLILLLDSAGKVVAWDDDSGVNLDAVLRYCATRRKPTQTINCCSPMQAAAAMAM